MSNNIVWKSFSLCFSKFKCLPSLTFNSPPTDEQHQKFTTNTSTINPSTCLKNFNSLYDLNPDNISTAAAAGHDISSSSDTDSVPDFSSAFASHRFFFSSPGSSNSIFEAPAELSLPPPLPRSHDIARVSGGIAVQTYSQDPYADFRKSMQEMMEDRKLVRDAKTDWDFLHELLLCYLTLNPKHTHKFIVSAFADVIISFLSPSAEDICRKTINQRPCANVTISDVAE